MGEICVIFLLIYLHIIYIISIFVVNKKRGCNLLRLDPVKLK